MNRLTLSLAALLASCAVAGPASAMRTTPDLAVTAAPTDIDADSIPDDVDRCAGTSANEAVDGTGCSLPQLCPCTTQKTGTAWASHRAWRRCVGRTLRRLLRQERLSKLQADTVRLAARKTSCGATEERSVPEGVRCCVPAAGVQAQAFCVQSTTERCTALGGDGLGAGSCRPTNPCP